MSSTSSDAFMRDGGSESRYVKRQAAKPAPGDQPPLATLLPPLELFEGQAKKGAGEGAREASTAASSSPSSPSSSCSSSAPLLVDALVVGAGPAGLALAAELAERGLSVGIVARDEPFVNMYGVWVDEFEAMGLLKERKEEDGSPSSSSPPPPSTSTSSPSKSVLAQSWPSAHCFFGPGSKPTVVQRGYGRVDAARLRSLLVERARSAGVKFAAGEVVSAGRGGGGGSGGGGDVSSTSSSSPSPSSPLVARLSDGRFATASLVTLACGASGARLLEYEGGAPAVAAQTAYGIEAVVEGYGGEVEGETSPSTSSSPPSSSPSSSSSNYDPDSMLFMDYRRHHTGVWEGTATKVRSGNHPLGGGGGLWGTGAEAPSFLYAMPGEEEEEEEEQEEEDKEEENSALPSSASPPAPARRRRRRRVFLEETCLVARPPLPFSTLKRRLQRRLAAAGVEVVSVKDEEWSFIPVGGPLPRGDQTLTAFGAAGGLVHPATGYSVARSLREAPVVAAAVAKAVEEEREKRKKTSSSSSPPSSSSSPSSPCATSGIPPEALSSAFWGALWPAGTRRAAAFHVFGMELLAKLGPSDTDAFFGAFFALPPRLWRGFLSSRLSSAELVLFALATFVKAPMGVRIALVKHMLLDPSGRHLVRAYLGGGNSGDGGGNGGGGATSGGNSDFESSSTSASAVSAPDAASDVAATS